MRNREREREGGGKGGGNSLEKEKRLCAKKNAFRHTIIDEITIGIVDKIDNDFDIYISGSGGVRGGNKNRKYIKWRIEIPDFFKKKNINLMKF